MASFGYGGLSNRAYLTQVRLTTQHATLSYRLSRSATTSSIATRATVTPDHHDHHHPWPPSPSPCHYHPWLPWRHAGHCRHHRPPATITPGYPAPQRRDARAIATRGAKCRKSCTSQG